MNVVQGGLILEGGGLRGVYTSGVLRFFMDKGLYFPYVIAASMGACNAANYISRQPERNRIVNIRYVNDARYMSYLRAILKSELFGMDFIFNTIPNSLTPFDFGTFKENETKFYITVTDCITGDPIYYEKNEVVDDLLTVLQASCSLPFISKPVSYKNRVLMDGGIADSIPVRKSIDDGNIKNVVVLTRPSNYRKKRSKSGGVVKRWYPNYPGMCKALVSRHIVYNETLDFINEKKNNGELFVIQPEADMSVGRVTRNKDKLYALYDQGYEDASNLFPDLIDYLDK